MDQDLRKDLQRLARERPGAAALEAPPTLERILSTTGFGQDSAARGGGINGPLTETSYADRTWYTARYIVSTDGILTLQVRDPAVLSLIDGDGQSIPLILADPNET